MKAAFMAHLLLFQELADNLNSFLKSRAAFIERNAEPAEFMRKEGTRESDFQPAFADGVEHSDLAGKLQWMIESRQDRAGD